MAKYKIALIYYHSEGITTYEYAIINNYNGSKIKGGFSNEWEARLWANTEGEISILDLI